MGYLVVRMSPYHCQYNPIELIWVQIKFKVAKLNTTFKIVVVEKLVYEVIESVTAEDWKRCIEHYKKLQDDDFIKEGLRDEILEPIILTINSDKSSDNSEDDDEGL
jgi:hypothetical protein